MGDKKFTDKIADAAKVFLNTAKSVATSEETKAAIASAKDTISKAVKTEEKPAEVQDGEKPAEEKSSEDKAPEEKAQEGKAEEGKKEEDKKEGE